ncbi:MAG TPA: TIGR00282 family metallophosphoesterase [Patescibacteria group bacterium]|nr:TIGR00282 family metallophosphoesterase [Patescibacteria group bacterium]
MAAKANILFIGDIVGEAGMKAVREYLPKFIEQYESDFVIVNGENIVNGKGLTETEASELFTLGADVITTGNHIWENWKSRPLLATNPMVLRPFNYPPENPGRGYAFATLPSGREIAVLQLQGRVYMQPIDCPFRSADYALTKIYARTNLVITDFHADATAEKVAMAWHLDGRVSAVVGTHTHIQTADACLMPKGTAYITDVGMTGPYDSVLGMRKDVALKRAILQTAHKYEIADGDARIAGVHIVINEENSHAEYIESFVYPEANRGAKS